MAIYLQSSTGPPRALGAQNHPNRSKTVASETLKPNTVDSKLLTVADPVEYTRYERREWQVPVNHGPPCLNLCPRRCGTFLQKTKNKTRGPRQSSWSARFANPSRRRQIAIQASPHRPPLVASKQSTLQTRMKRPPSAVHAPWADMGIEPFPARPRLSRPSWASGSCAPHLLRRAEPRSTDGDALLRQLGVESGAHAGRAAPS